ncbi:MAG: DNA repair protein RecO [Candidatus Saccharimonas sp.]
MSAEKTQAIVLRRTNYGEADRILLLLTPLGQRSAIAKGSRREKSKLAGSIEPFSVIDVVITSSKSDLGILTSARLVQFFDSIIEDYDRLQFGYEATSLVLRASSQVDDPGWFEVLSEVYAGLDSPAVSMQFVQCWFYLRYAELSGYALSFERDVAGQPLIRNKLYMYDVHERGLRLSEQGDISSDHIKLLRILSAKSLMIAAQIGGIGDILPGCWLLARQHASF